MTEQPIDPDAEYRARFDELEFQRAIEEAEEQRERNTRSLADVFIEYMDRADTVEVAVGAQRWSGLVLDVGHDHVTLEVDDCRVDVALGAVTLTKVVSPPSVGVVVVRTPHCPSFVARLRDLSGANAGVVVEIGGAVLPTISGQLSAVAESHVELMTLSGDLYVISLGAIGFVRTSV